MKIGDTITVQGVITGLDFNPDGSLRMVRVSSAQGAWFGGWFTGAEVIAGPGHKVIPWPPTGDMVQAGADELAPYAESPAEYERAVAQACDVIDAALKA